MKVMMKMMIIMMMMDDGGENVKGRGQLLKDRVCVGRVCGCVCVRGGRIQPAERIQAKLLGSS